MTRKPGQYRAAITHKTQRQNTGMAEKIYDHWFMSPIPPKNSSLNLPMSYLLRDSWKYPSDVVVN